MGAACIIRKTTTPSKTENYTSGRAPTVLFLFDLIYYLFCTFFASDIDRVFCIVSPRDPHVKQMKTQF